MAMACGPELLIADEPTTALDVTIQGEILDLIGELVDERDMALLLISHDLGVMARTVGRMLVMYGGTIVEAGSTAQVFRHLAHPYTRGLFGARPRLGAARGTRLVTIPGRVPELVDMPAGCPFADRCAWVVDACRVGPPPAVDVEPGHSARCIRLGAVAAGPPRAGRARPERRDGRRMKPAGPAAAPPLLEVVDVVKHYTLPRERLFEPAPRVEALRGVSFTMTAGTSLGLVGESGSGKSTLARMAMALERPTAGQVRLLGRDLNALSASELRAARRDFQMVFQDPYGSLDPRLRRRPHRRRAARRDADAPTAARASPRRSTPSACARATPPSTRTSSPAASASASRSPAR